MNVLINKSILRKDLSALSSKNGYVKKSDVMRILGEQECAYNLDKVLELLEYQKSIWNHDEVADQKMAEAKQKAYDMAIKIVKSGECGAN